MQKNFITRKITPEDAPAYLALSTLLDNESVFRAYEPGERPASVSDMGIYIYKLLASGNSIIFLAFDGDKLCGYIEAIGGIYNRNRHSAHINLAVLKEYSGMGVASLLFQDLFCWARELKLRRIDLTVFTYNTPAINLYNKLGFETEGIKKDSFKVDGSFVDEFIMAKYL
ncbi:MAG: N-acetyltransferase family protein [Ignavibacteriaceae bacterium]